MKIQDQRFVKLHYTLSLDTGETVEKSDPNEPLGFVYGSSQIIPGLEKELEGMEPGDKTRVDVGPDQAYGPHRPELLQEIPRQSFPPDLELQPGMTLQAMGPQGPMILVVKAIADDKVTVDMNHPLAGKTLSFDVEVAEVRDATEDELQAAAGCGTDGGCSGCGGGCG